MDLLQYALILGLIATLGYVLYRTALWAERDALLRGKSPLFVMCAVILFFPWGLIAWLIFRPDPVDGGVQSSRTFDLDDFREQ